MPFLSRLPSENVLFEFEGTEFETGYTPERNTWEVIIKYNGDILSVANEIGAEIEILNQNYAIMTISYDKVPLLSNYSQIEYTELPRILTLNLKEEISRSCITSVKTSQNYDLTGEGTIIGIIDSGIDYTHPDFINEDGTTRILYMWDQTLNGTPPEGFNHGAEYSNEDINRALQSQNPLEIVPEADTLGHGTAVAGIAAGNGRSSNGENEGVAPKASLIVVKLGEKGFPSFARTTEFMRALKYVIEKALMLQMPIAINISYGTNDGPHNGQSLFELFINDMSERWKTSIVVASGNEGSAGHHYMGEINSGQMQEVSFFYSGKSPSFYVSLWKNFVDSFTVELILPNGQSTGEILYYDRIKSYRFADISVIINYGQPQFYNAFQEIFFQINSNTKSNPVGIFTLRIRAAQIVYGGFNIYLPTTEEVSEETTFTLPSIDHTLTLPSTAQNVITVGGYDSARDITASFSGRGYTLNFIYVKPDLVAPAVDILTTKTNGGYGVFTGTSMAAPFVTGCASLLMQWGIVQSNDPYLYGERIKAYLKSGARRKTGIDYPNNAWGYGTLCLANTLSQLRNFGRTT